MAARGRSDSEHARRGRVHPRSVPRLSTEGYGKYEKKLASYRSTRRGRLALDIHVSMHKLIAPTLQPHARLLHGTLPPVAERITVAERVAVQARK